MAAFLYFVPEMRADGGQTVVDMGEIVKRLPDPLRDLFGERQPELGSCTAGPDGKPGLVLAVRRPGVGYHPKKQTWANTGRGYWLGSVNGGLPGPEDLKRPTMLRGSDVELADGHTWHIPAAPFLPRRMILEGERLVPGDVLESFRDLNDAAGRFWSALDSGQQGDGLARVEYSELADLAAVAIGGNYHLGKREIVELGLFTTANVQKVCRALVDFDEWIRMCEAEEAEKDPDAAKKAEAAQDGGD